MTARQEKTAKILLALIVLLGLALRLIWLSNVPTQPVTDFDWYYERAVGLAHGLGYTVNGVHTAYWPPGYPFFLGAFFKLFGPSVALAKALNLILSLAIVPLTYLLGRRLHPHPAVGILASAVTAVSISLIGYSSILASEPLYTVLTLSACLPIFSKDGQKPGPKQWAAAGALASLAALVRPQAILLPAILALARIPFNKTQQNSEKHTQQKPWLATAACLAALALVQLPWFIRNLHEFHAPVLISTNGGDNLWIGHHEASTGHYEDPTGRPADPQTELAHDREQRQKALAYLKQIPDSLFTGAPEKLSATFLASTDVPYWGFQTEKGKLVVPGAGDDKAQYKWVKNQSFRDKSTLFWMALTGLVFGLFTSEARRAALLPVLMVGYTGLLSVLFFGNPRFGFPAIPFQALLIGLIPAFGYWFIFEHRPPPKTHDPQNEQSPPDNADEDVRSPEINGQ